MPWGDSACCSSAGWALLATPKKSSVLEQVLVDSLVERQLARERRRKKLSEPLWDSVFGPLQEILTRMRVLKPDELGAPMFLSETFCGRIVFDDDALWVALYRTATSRFGERLRETAERLGEPAEQSVSET